MQPAQTFDKCWRETWLQRRATCVRKHRRVNEEKSDEASGADDLRVFKEMWEKSLRQEDERFEKSMKMLQENQKMQMVQTASLLSGFKDIMKE